MGSSKSKSKEPEGCGAGNPDQGKDEPTSRTRDTVAASVKRAEKVIQQMEEKKELKELKDGIEKKEKNF